MWGTVVGALLVIDRLLPLGDSARWSWPAQLLGILVTFQLWCLGGVFFRAPDLTTAFAMLGSLATGSWSWPEPAYALALALCVPGFLAVDLAEEIHPGDGYAVAVQPFWQKIALAIGRGRLRADAAARHRAVSLFPVLATSAPCKSRWYSDPSR